MGEGKRIKPAPRRVSNWGARGRSSDGTGFDGELFYEGGVKVTEKFHLQGRMQAVLIPRNGE